MMGKRLLAIELKKLPAGMHADGAGLYLDVRNPDHGPGFSERWFERKHIGLGGLSTISLAEARQKAAQLRRRPRVGEDILESRRIERRVIPIFKEAALTYHVQISETFDGDKHSRNWVRSLEQYVFPTFGQKTVDVIDTADVLRAIGPIWKTGPDTARRTLRRVKAIFDTARHRATEASC